MSIQIGCYNSTASLANDTHTTEEHQPATRAQVCFSDKTQTITFQKTTSKEAPLYWYNDKEMQDMTEDVNHTVKRYLKKCGNYRVAMSKIAARCSQVHSQQVSITALLDPTVLIHIADAKARGMEHHIISPHNQGVVQEVLAMQDREETTLVVASRYKELSKRARLMAKTMGDGDALVANKILERTVTQTAVETKDVIQTASFSRSLPKAPRATNRSLSPRRPRPISMRERSS